MNNLTVGKKILLNIFLLQHVMNISTSERLREGGCSSSTNTDYCPSSCAVENAIREFHDEADSVINRHKEKLDVMREYVEGSRDANGRNLMESLMREEQVELKRLVTELKTNATKQRQLMIDLLSETNEQETVVNLLFSELNVLSETCRTRCITDGSSDLNGHNYLNDGLHHLSDCAGQICGKAAYGMTILAREPENDRGEVCLEFSTTQLESCAQLFSMGYKKNGIYHIQPQPTKRAFPVYCDMEDGGGGWTVVQRRVDGSLDFNRTWQEYKQGFGNVSCSQEYWIGNEKLAIIGLTGYQTARFILTDWENETRVAQYSYFRVNQESHSYTLQISAYQREKEGVIVSNASDAMTSGYYRHNNMAFTTYDQNNIFTRRIGNCPKGSGGWWFNSCNAANLNGFYHRGIFNPRSQPEGIKWVAWKGKNYSLKATEIKLRPYGFTAG